MFVKRVSAQMKSNPKAKKVASTAPSLVQLDQQIWPLERDILFRPGRLKYVRRLIQTQDCVFCSSAKNAISLKTLCVYKSKFCQIILNKFPYNSGHLLVLPLEHRGQIFDLSSKVYTDLHLTLKIAMQAIQNVYQPSGFNVGMNHGAAGGAGIPDHLHYHIVPRWNGDLNFFPLIAETKLVVETVEQTYGNFQKYFKNLSRGPSQKGSV